MTEGDEFALPDIDWNNYSRDWWKQKDQQSPDTRAMKEKQPAAYQRYFAIYDEGFSKRQTQGEVFSKARSLYREVLRENLPYVSDKVALEYARLTLEELAQLERVSPVLCSDFFYAPKADLSYSKYFADKTQERDRQLVADVINSADLKRTLPTETQASPLLGKASSLMHKRTGEDVVLINKMRTAEGRAEIGPAKTCKITAAFYRELLELPPDQAAAVLRYLFGTFDVRDRLF